MHKRWKGSVMKSGFVFSNFFMHSVDKAVEIMRHACFAPALNFSFQLNYITCGTGIMPVSAFLRDGIKFLSKKYTRFLNCDHIWCTSFVALS